MIEENIKIIKRHYVNSCYWKK